MALRQLLLGREREALMTERGTLAATAEEIRARRTVWQEREARAVAALSEMTEEVSAEDRASFDAECAEIETEDTTLTAEEEAMEARSAEIDARVAEIDRELREHNERAKGARGENGAQGGAQGAQAGEERETTAYAERKGEGNMEIRERVRAMVRESEEVRTFLGKVRETRGVTGAQLTVPTVMLPMLMDAEDRYSKLARFVSNTRVKGDTKMNIIGAAPEAVWTEATGKFNELNLALTQITVDGHKVGGYIAVPNAYLEDSDEALGMLVMESLGQSLGYAKDKAILYGTGSNMPVGIMTRLAASASPAWWGANKGTFTALNTSHVGKLSASSVTGLKRIQEAAKVLGKAKAKVRNGADGKFWAMSSETRLELLVDLMNVNASGALVSSMEEQFPVLGGTIVTLDFMPAGDIIGGYGSQYKYVTRRGIVMRQLNEIRALDDQTVFLGSERADGKPIAGEGFAAFNIHGQNVTTSLDFAEDTANAETTAET